MGQWTKARIQLCGRLVADIDGSRIEDALPGRLGRVLFAYLALNRGRPVPRNTLLMAGWGEDAPAEATNALSVLLSKLRHGLGPELAPYRETGYRLLMEALARRGNIAEALRAYDGLRVLLREELGIAPSPVVQEVHRSLLQSTGS
jgi:DNA-binding SARP family transcriptional activator